MLANQIELIKADHDYCDICSTPDGTVVYCEQCWVGVHVDCYGGDLVQGIPEGEWYCKRCLAMRA